MFWLFSKLRSTKLSKKSILEDDKDEELFIQLDAAFGESKALEIIRDIKQFKDNNKGKAFKFIFNELGQFKAIEKKKDLDKEDE